MKRIILHIPVGLLLTWLTTFNPVLAVLFFLGFAMYELNEDYYLKDQAWKDVAGLLWGIGFGSAYLIISKFLLEWEV